jgi:hypothetical protein
VIKAALHRLGSNKALDIQPNAVGDDTLMTLNDKGAYGQFKTIQVTKSPNTYIVVSPQSGGAIVLTDLIVNTDKAAGSDITVRFSDGTNIVSVFYAQTVDAAVNFGLSFAGRWRGWKDARIETVITGNTTCSVAIGYFKVKSSVTQSFSDWDAGR